MAFPPGRLTRFRERAFLGEEAVADFALGAAARPRRDRFLIPYLIRQNGRISALEYQSDELEFEVDELEVAVAAQQAEIRNLNARVTALEYRRPIPPPLPPCPRPCGGPRPFPIPRPRPVRGNFVEEEIIYEGGYPVADRLTLAEAQAFNDRGLGPRRRF